MPQMDGEQDPRAGGVWRRPLRGSLVWGKTVAEFEREKGEGLRDPLKREAGCASPRAVTSYTTSVTENNTNDYL